MKRRTTSWLAGLLGLVLFLGFGAFFAWRFAIGWTPPRDQYPAQGVFVGMENGAVRWPSLALLGADFAYIRATAGSDGRDPEFATNRNGAMKNGIRYGAVHRYSLCRLASDQASNFVTFVPRDTQALPPAVEFAFGADCKDRPARSLVLSELNTFLNQIEHHSGKPALLLLRRDFEEEYDIGSGINRTIWLEGDFFPPDYASKPWVMWLANSHYRIEGIEGPVNWNVIRP